MDQPKKSKAKKVLTPEEIQNISFLEDLNKVSQKGNFAKEFERRGKSSVSAGPDQDQLKAAGTTNTMFLGDNLDSVLEIKSQRQKDEEAAQIAKAKADAIKANRIDQLKKSGSALSKLPDAVGDDETIKVLDQKDRVEKLEDKTFFGKMKNIVGGYWQLATSLGDGKEMLSAQQKLAKGYFGSSITAKEEKEITDLKKTLDKTLVPYTKELRLQNRSSLVYQYDKDKELKDRLKVVEDAYNKIDAFGPNKQEKLRLGAEKERLFNEISIVNATIRSREDFDSMTGDYLDKGGSVSELFQGIGYGAKDIGNLGTLPMVDSYMLNKILAKKEEIKKQQKLGKNAPPLTQAEQEYFDAVEDNVKLKDLNLEVGNGAYNTGIGVGGSLQFMGELIATRGFGTMTKQAVTSGIKLGLRAAAKQGIRQGVKNFAKRGTSALVGLTAQGMVTPFMYRGAIEHSIGKMEIDKETGKLLVGTDLYDKKKLEYDDSKAILRRAIKEEKDPEKKAEYEDMIASLDAELDSLQPNGVLESAAYGMGEFLKEAISEEYVGRALGAGGKFVGSGLRKSEKIGKALDFAGEKLSAINRPFRKANIAINNLTKGRLSTSQIGVASKGSLIGSIPEEMMEEVFVQAVPSVGQSWEEYKEQASELINPDFYKDVAIQTALIGGGFQTLGTLKRIQSNIVDQDKYNKIMSQLNMSQAQIEALNLKTKNPVIVGQNANDTLAKAQKKYWAVSAKLREEGRNQEADILEERMFINLAEQAARLGNLDSFKKGMDELSQKKDMPASFHQNAIKAKASVDAIHEAYMEHSDKDNFGEILSATVNKTVAEQNISFLENNLLKLEEPARQAIEDFKTRTGKSFDYDLVDLKNKKFEEPEDQKQYDSVVNELISEDKENLAAVQAYVQAQDLIKVSKEQVASNRKTINDELSPKRQEKLEAKKALREEFELLQEDLESGAITFPGVSVIKKNEEKATEELDRKAVKGPQATRAILSYIKENYGDKIDTEDFQVLADEKLREAGVTNEQNYFEEAIKAEEKAQEASAESASQTATPYNEEETENEEDNEDTSVTAPIFHQSVPLFTSQIPSPVPTTKGSATVSPASNQTDVDTIKVEIEKLEYVRDNQQPLKPLIFEDQYSKQELDDIAKKHQRDVKGHIDNMNKQISQKQAELKALEETGSTTTQSDIEVQNLPNDNSDVDSYLDGIYDIEGEPAIWNEDSEVVMAMEEGLTDMAKQFEEKTGNRMRLGDLFNFYKKTDALEEIKPNFWTIATAWRNLTKKLGEDMYPAENFDKFYDEYYDTFRFKAFIDQVGEVEQTPKAEVISSEVVVPEKITPRIIEEDIDGREIAAEQEVVAISTKTANVSPKIGFQALEYQETEEDGVHNKITTGNQVRLYGENGVNIYQVIDPNGIQNGDEVSMEVSNESEWANTTISFREGKQKRTMKFLDWVKEKEKIDPNFRTTDEFINKVPMYYVSKGVRIGAVHDQDWYNGYNIKNPSDIDVNPHNPTGEWAELIQKGKDAHTLLRKQIISGQVSKGVVRRQESPIFERLEFSVSLEENNPQSEVVVVVDGKPKIGTSVSTMHITNKEIFSQRGPDNKYLYNGHVFEVRREGRVKLEDGTWVDSYRAFFVERDVEEDQIETVKWALAANAFLSNSISYLKNSSNEQLKGITKEIAENIQREIKQNTGIDILTNVTDFVELILQIRADKRTDKSKLADLQNIFVRDNLSFATDTPGGDASSFVSQHTSKEALARPNFKSMVHIKNGVITVLGMPYKKYLKNTLKTSVASYNIGTEEAPNYVTFIQPIVNIDPVLSEQEEVPTKEEVVTEKTVEKVEEQNKKETPVFIESQHKTILENLGIDIEDYLESEEGDSSIANDLGPISKLTNVIGGINTPQMLQIRESLLPIIASLKKLNSKEQIKEQSKEILFQELDKVREQLSSGLELLNKQSDLTPTMKAYQKAYQDNLDNIDTVEQQWETIFAGVSMYYERITKTTIEQSEDELQEKNYSKDSVEANSKLSAGTVLKNFLLGIPKKNQDNSHEKGYLGMKKYYGFNESFNEVVKILSLGYDIPSDFEIVKNKLKKAGTPFTDSILERLENADEQTKNQFLYTVAKHNMKAVFSMYSSSRGNKSYNANSNEASRVIIKNWKNNLKTSPLYNRDQTLNVSKAKELISTYKKFEQTNINDIDKDKVRKWLSDTGIVLTDLAWNKIISEGTESGTVSFEDLLFGTSNGLLRPAANALEKQVASSERGVTVSFEEDSNLYSDLNQKVNGLARVEAVYNTRLTSLSYLDGDKKIYTQTNPTFMSDRVEEIKQDAISQDKSLVTGLSKTSFARNSMILEALQVDSKFRDNFALQHAAIATLQQDKRDMQSESGPSYIPDPKSIADLTALDYDLNVGIHFSDRKLPVLSKDLAFMQRGEGEHIPLRLMRMLSPTMSDKSKAYFLDTVGLDLLNSNELPLIGEDVSMTDNLKDFLVHQLIMPELERILNFHSNVKQTGIDSYDMGATKFHLISAVNSLKLEGRERSLLEELATTPKSDTYNERTIFKEYGSKFREIIEKVVMAEVSNKKQLWKGNEGKILNNSYFLLKPGETPNYEKGIYDFVINGMLHNSEVYKLFAGDLALYSKDKLYRIERKDPLTKEDKYKDIKDFTQEDWYNINKNLGINLGKRLAELAAPGSPLANSYKQKYNQIFLEDVKEMADNVEFLISLHYGKEALTEEVKKMLSTYENNSNIILNYESGKTGLGEAATKAKKEQEQIAKTLAGKFEKIKDFFDIESTDAQEYTTLTEHIHIIESQGRVSPDKMDKLISIKEKIRSGEDFSEEELGIILQPIKPVHTGSYVDEINDVNRFIYIKSSSYPLIPQFTRGTRLDNFRVKMEELERTTGRFTRASYHTANKVGGANSNNRVNPFDVHSLDKIKEYANDDKNASVLVLDRKNFRIQQDTPIKSEKEKADKNAMGTQIFKMLMGDGICQIKEQVFPVDGKNLSGKALKDFYYNAFTEMIEVERQKLYTELGLSNKGEVLNKDVTMKKVQKLLEKEAINRNYSLKSIAGLKIEKISSPTGAFYEFKNPIWLSSDKNRYENLISSIVTNRIMQFKIPGNSYIAASSAGVGMSVKKEEDLTEAQKNQIVYLDNFNGKGLQGGRFNENGDYEKPQVFIRCHIKDPKTRKIIDILEGYDKKTGDVSNAKYLIRNANGTLGLKKGMIDPSLLNHFSFRTPTSSHVSGATVEIAGFLPHEMGEVMFVPNGFTKQKGMDFDVDKEGTYQLNHYINERGEAKEVNEEYLQELKLELQALNFYRVQEINSKKGIKNAILELENKLKVSSSFIYQDHIIEEIDALWELLGEETKNWDAEVSEDSLKDIKDAIKDLELTISGKIASAIPENKFIKAHLAVYNSKSIEVQQRINSVLSMDFAQNQRDLLLEASEKGEKDLKVKEFLSMGMSPQQAEDSYWEGKSNETFLSYTYQKKKLELGVIGKTAIGVYANFSTFAALLQQNDTKVKLPKEIIIGDIVSDGTLGSIETIRPEKIEEKDWNDFKRSVSKAFEEKENTATDNEKEQILAAVGIDGQTINVDALLTLLGIDKSFATIDGKKTAISIPYYLLSQPSVKKYNKELIDSKGILSPLKELKSSEDIDNSKKEKFVFQPELLTGQNLYDSIINPNSEKSKVIQENALALFKELQEVAKEVADVQKIVDRNDLGMSMVETMLATRDLEKLAKNNTFGAMALLGEVSEIPTEGFYPIGSVWIKPTTPQGQIVIPSLSLGNTLFKDFFPYDDPAFKKVINEILTVRGITSSTSDTVRKEAIHKIIEEITKYINSNPSNNVFEGEIQEKRQELFLDSESNQSLALYMKSLLQTKSSKGVNQVIKNPLYKSLSFDVDPTGLTYSTINYNNSVTDNLEEDILYAAIPELIHSNSPLPPRKGKPYTTRMLAQDMIAYNYLEGGVQKVVQFSKYVPTEVLDIIGKYENKNGNEVFVSASSKFKIYNNRTKNPTYYNSMFGIKEEGLSSFTTQYFQSNPSDVSSKGISAKGTFNIEKQKFTLKKEGSYPEFLYQGFLFKHVGGGHYVKLPSVSGKISEYAYKEPYAKSILSKEEVSLAPVVEKSAFNEVVSLNNTTTPEALLEQLSNLNFSSEYQYLAETSKWLLPYLKQGKVKIVLSEDNMSGASGFTTRPTSNGEIIVKINPNFYAQATKEKGTEIVLHEILHSITVSHLLQYYNENPSTKETTLRTDIDIPSHVKALDEIFTQIRNKFNENKNEDGLGEIEVLQNKIANNKNKNLTRQDYTERELNIIYGATNIFEFVSVGLTNKEFLSELNGITDNNGKSFAQIIKDILLSLLETVHPGIKQNTLAAQAILSTMNFIQEERTEIKSKVTPVVTTVSTPITYGKDPNLNIVQPEIKPENNSNINISNEEVKNRYEEAVNTISLERINKLLNYDNKNTDSIEKGRKWLKEEFGFLFDGDNQYISNFKYHASQEGVQDNFENRLHGDTQKDIDYAVEYSSIAKDISNYVIKPENNNLNENLKPSEFTNHSGGAKGYDAEWDIIGAEYGMINNNHYLLPSDGSVSDSRLVAKGVKPVDATKDVGDVALTGPATGEAQKAVTNAERIMGRIEPNHVTRNTKKIRNYSQVKNADGIFAIGSLIPKGTNITLSMGRVVKKALVPQVNGGTSVAVQLGIMMNKPTYVFNQTANEIYHQGWYKWDNIKQDFILIDTPTLTKNFAGIGTSSNTTEQGKQAIRDVYEETFNNKTEIKPENNNLNEVEQIYTQLGDKTVNEGGNVVINSVYQQSGVQYAKSIGGVFSLRVNNSEKHFGNPFSSVPTEIAKGLIATKSTKESVEKYIDWVINSKDSRAEWIREQLKSGSLKGKPIVYYKELEEPSHATALDYLINEYDWNNLNETGEKELNYNKNNNTFSYKDKTIDTDFNLTNEQTKALEKLIDFVEEGKSSTITLSGYAGTGKTTMIKYLEKYLKEADVNFIYASPTHAASAYLALNTLTVPNTTQSLFKKAKNKFTEKEESMFTNKGTNLLSLYKDNVLIIDESSMLSDKDINTIVEASSENLVKVIFMGDKAQLPTPDGGNVKQVSKVFTEFESIQLSEVKRTSDVGILNVLTEIRNNPENVLPMAEDSESLKYFNSALTFEREAYKEIKKDPHNTIYIAYQNSAVQSFNKKVREAEGFKDGLTVGESIIGYAGYNSKQLTSGNLGNSLKYEVTDIKKEDSKIKISFKSDVLSKIPALKDAGLDNGNTKYYQLSSNDSLIFNSVTEEDMAKNNKILSEILSPVFEAKQMAIKNGGGYWRELEEQKQKASVALRGIELGNKYIYNPVSGKMEIYSINQHGTSNPELVVDKGIDYGYAITTHKSQGATFKNVFYNAASSENQNTPIYENGVQIGNEGNSLMYVGMSRASEKLYVLAGDKTKKIENTEKEEAIGNIQEQKNITTFDNSEEVWENNKEGFIEYYGNEVDAKEIFDNLTPEEREHIIKNCL